MRSLISLASRGTARAAATASAAALRPALPSLLARSSGGAAMPLLSSRFSTSAVARQQSPWGGVMSALDHEYTEAPAQAGKVKVSHAAALEAAWATRPLIGLPIQPDPPSFGRSVRVNDNDVAGAYRILNSVLRRNNVRRELKLTERYEKPTQTRRRLLSERHRRRFADLVRKRVQLAMEIKRRGA